MYSKHLLAFVFAALVPAFGEAQTTADQATSSGSSSTQRRGDSPFLGSPEEELRSRAAIKHAEESHRENLERAGENARLGSELHLAFERHQTLGRDELKKLERMEKLARKIRGQIGGSDDDQVIEDPPRELTAAVSRLAETSEDLQKCVLKTSRHVVSTSIIERANEVIELIRYIRSFKSQ